MGRQSNPENTLGAKTPTQLPQLGSCRPQTFTRPEDPNLVFHVPVWIRGDCKGAG